MSDSRIEGYARGLFEIARAEGTIDEVEDELFRFARSYESGRPSWRISSAARSPAPRRS
jgi:F-type H+-transporting ATPase subunit delta